MTLLSPSTSDIPGRYDVIINGKGYIFLRTIDTSLPFRTQRALYSRTATFLPRQNVGPSYGDEAQDFFMTGAQNNWAGGDGQRFLHLKDDDSKSRFYLCSAVDVSIPGQVKLMPDVRSLTFAAAVNVVGSSATALHAASATNLYQISTVGTISDLGAHGCGGQPQTIAYDGSNLYLSSSASVRRYSFGGGSFSTFSATGSVPLAFVSNTLFGYNSSNGFGYYDTSGTFTSALPRKDAVGTALGNSPNRFVPLGGKMAALVASQTPGGNSEIWVGDTTGFQRVAEFPPNFSAADMVEHLGTLFVIGIEYNAAVGQRTAIYYYANGEVGKLYASPNWTTTGLGGLGIAVWGSGLIFTDGVTTTIKIYELVTGATSSVAAWSINAASLYRQTMNSAQTLGLVVNGTTAGTLFFHSTSVVSSGYVMTSLIDFDNSLTKQFRGVKIDFIAGTDGNGGTVDVAYQVDSLDGSYTAFQTGVTSGTEYLFSSVSGRSISIKVTLNKGSSTYGPTLKRIYVRAAPQLQSYRVCEYVLDCSGVDGKVPVILNDNETSHPLDGLAQATNLSTVISTTSPITVSDRFGSYTAVPQPEDCEIIEVSPEEYIIRMKMREV